MSPQALVAAFNGLNVVASFAVHLLIYRAFGASTETDAYFASLAIPQLLAAVLATTSAGALVPALAGQASAEQNRHAWALLIAVGGAVALLTVPMSVFTGAWTPMLFPGFIGSHQTVVAKLAAIQVLAVPFIAANAVLTALHQARGLFLRVEAIGLCMSLSVALGLHLALPRFGLIAAAWLFFAKHCLQTMVLAAILEATRAPLRLSDVLPFWRPARVLLVGNAYFKTDILVDRHLLSMGAAGSMSLFSLAQTMYAAVAGIIGQGWGSTAVPGLSVSYGRRDRRTFLALVWRNGWRIAVVALLAFALVSALAQPVLSALTSQRVTTEDGTALWVLLLLLGGIPLFASLGSLVSGAFYATGDTATPTVVSAVTFTAFVIGKVVVFQSLGLAAFCILTTCYYAGNVIILGTILYKRLNQVFNS